METQRGYINAQDHTAGVKRWNQNPEMLASKLFSQAMVPKLAPKSGSTQLTLAAHRVYHTSGRAVWWAAWKQGWVRRLCGECHVPGFSYLTFPWTSLEHRPR